MVALDYYNYFYKVAVTGNITRAAKELYVTQPALSKSISRLENIMGCKLFIRSTKGVSLTLEGELLFQHVKETFKAFHETKSKIDAVKLADTAEIRIAVGADLCEQFLLREMEAFREKYPSTLIHVVIMPTSKMDQALREEQVDFAISTEPLSPEYVFSRRLFPLHDCFIVGEKYRALLESSPISLFELVNYPLIMLNKDSRTRMNFENVIRSYGIVVPPVHEIADTQLISKFVQQGHGIGCVTDLFVDADIKAGKVFRLPVLEYLPPRYAMLTWDEEKQISAVTKALIEQLEEAGETFAQQIKEES